MGNLAAMLKKKGHTVTGSDQNLYPPMSDRLREWGIEASPYSEKNIGKADLYIIGNAISRGNPEVEKILNLGLEYTSMAGAIREFFLKGKEVIVIAGTHGKTTTSFLMDHILSSSGTESGLIAGGVRADGMEGFRVPSAKAKYFVIEGDEYDTAFFDKHPKFLHYRPKYLILTSVEYDHADIYSDFEAYKTAFRRLLRIIPSEGLVSACRDDQGVMSVTENFSYSDILYYGTSRKKVKKSSGDKLRGFSRNGTAVNFDGLGEVKDFSLIGNHNTSNAMGAVNIALRIGIPPAEIIKALQTFPGVMRRQQIREKAVSSSGSEIILMEDFAHHPTAVKATIDAVRDAYPGYRIHALFEPRSASSHRAVFQQDYTGAFAGADSVWISEVFNINKVNRSEKLNVKKIISDLKSQGKTAVYGKNPAELLDLFRKKIRLAGSDSAGKHQRGDVILVMSNGAFGGIYPELDAFVRRHQGNRLST